MGFIGMILITVIVSYYIGYNVGLMAGLDRAKELVDTVKNRLGRRI